MADEQNIETEVEEPHLPVQPVTDQFAATEGTTEGLHAEVAHRSADGSDGDVFHKVFSLGAPTVPDDHPMHLDNARAVFQEALQRGLHPRGDVYLVRKTERDEPLNASGSRRVQSTELEYAVQVVPASIDTEAQDTATPASLNVQTTEPDRPVKSSRSSSRRTKK